SMEAINGAVTHQITGGPGGVDERLYVQLRAGDAALQTSGIEMAPIVEGYVAVGDQARQVLGIDPFSDATLRSHPTGASGDTRRDIAELQQWFTGNGTVMMTAQAARQLGLSVGSSFQLDIGGHAHPARLLATLGEAGLGFDTLMFTDIAQAQEWLGL